MEERSKREILADSPLFANLLPPEVDMLSQLVSERRYDAGQIVFNEGDIGDCLYILADGEVEVLRAAASGSPTTLALLRPPLFFGEMSLIDKEYRSATVRARLPTRLLILTNANLHVFAKSFRNGFTWMMVNIARVLSSRLREANRRLAERG